MVGLCVVAGVVEGEALHPGAGVLREVDVEVSVTVVVGEVVVAGSGLRGVRPEEVDSPAVVAGSGDADHESFSRMPCGSLGDFCALLHIGSLRRMRVEYLGMGIACQRTAWCARNGLMQTLYILGSWCLEYRTWSYVIKNKKLFESLTPSVIGTSEQAIVKLL